MNKLKYLMTIGIMLSVMTVLVACAGKTQVKSDLYIKHAPDWVNEGTNILKNRNGRLFHGVGSAPAMGDMSLQTSTADNRARAELARILSSYMEVVSNDYSSATPTAGEANSSQSISRQIENLTRVNLTGSRIIGRWRDKKTDTIYSIAELDMKQVKQTLEGVQDMNQGLKQYLTSEGDNIFDRMAEDVRR